MTKADKKPPIELILLLAAALTAIAVNERDIKKHPRPEPKYEEYSDQTPVPRTPVLNWFRANVCPKYK